LLSSWKRHLTGDFFIVKHADGGSYFIGKKNEVYKVKGLNDSIEELLDSLSLELPCFAHATLLPFKGDIITDGLVMPYPIDFGLNVTNDLIRIYKEARKEKKVITSL